MVQHLSPTHSLLLNKFNVVDYHVSTAWLPVRISRAPPALPVLLCLPNLPAGPLTVVRNYSACSAGVGCDAQL